MYYPWLVRYSNSPLLFLMQVVQNAVAFSITKASFIIVIATTIDAASSLHAVDEPSHFYILRSSYCSSASSAADAIALY